MYDSGFICTYKMLDDDDLYRIQFLQALELKKWDGDKIDKTLNKIQKICVDYTEIHEAIQAMGGGGYGFLLLFSYDYFDAMHLCLCDILTKKEIQKNHYDELMKIIHKNNK